MHQQTNDESKNFEGRMAANSAIVRIHWKYVPFFPQQGSTFGVLIILLEQPNLTGPQGSPSQCVPVVWSQIYTF